MFKISGTFLIFFSLKNISQERQPGFPNDLILFFIIHTLFSKYVPSFCRLCW